MVSSSQVSPQSSSIDCGRSNISDRFNIDLTKFSTQQISGYGFYADDDDEDMLGIGCPRGVVNSTSKTFSSSSSLKLSSPRSVATGISSLENSPCPSPPPNEWIGPRMASTESEKKRENDKTIVFVFDNNRTPVSCRSFESLISSRITQVELTVHGYRIVQDITGEVAEFKVRMTFNG
jgi:hypothetical protein